MKLTINPAEISSATKWLIGAVITFGGLMEIPIFGDTITAWAKYHPHVAVAIGVLTTIATILTNPKVESILGISISGPATDPKVEIASTGPVTVTETK